jgi:beta-galactosidase
VWRPEPLVHLMPHWNWAGFEGKSIPVWCVTNCDSVELFLDGKSLGERNLDRAKSLHVEWSVPYTPGTLKAVGKKDGRVVASEEVRTVGSPARLTLKADRSAIAADGIDLSFVEVQVVDKDGRVCPNADNLVRFKLSGPATLGGVDNGDPISLESFKGDRHTVFHGLGLAVVKAARTPGKITLRAEADGLAPAEVQVTSDAVKAK